MHMKKVTMFVMETCPHCIKALEFLDRLKKEHPEYQQIEIERIDEEAHPDIANRYDYWLVPTFYVGEEKLHEGVPTLDKVERVLKTALEA